MVTSVAKDEGKRFIGNVNVFIGEENAAATALVGFINRDPGLEFAPSMDSAELLVVDNSFPIADDVTTRRADVNFTLVQMETALLAMAIGETEDGQVVESGGAPAVQRRFSFKFTGVDADGQTKQLDVPSCTVVSNPTLTFTASGHSMIAVTLKVLGHPDNTYAWRWTDGDGSTTVTIATGDLDRVKDTPTTFHKVLGEGSVADDLDSITVGTGALEDNEIITLQISSIASPITVVNAATGTDTIDLTGTDDVILATLTDTLVLQYDLAGTEWLEVSRFITQ